MCAAPTIALSHGTHKSTQRRGLEASRAISAASFTSALPFEVSRLRQTEALRSGAGKRTHSRSTFTGVASSAEENAFRDSSNHACPNDGGSNDMVAAEHGARLQPTTETPK